MHDCFSSRADLHPVYEAMEQRFCTPISCAGRQSLLAGGPSAASLPITGGASNAYPSTGGGHTTYYVLVGCLLLILGGVYLSLYCWYAELRAGSGELKARPGRRRSGGLSMWLPVGRRRKQS